MVEYTKILAIIAAFGAHADSLNWSGLRDCFTGQVQVDYSALSGTPPGKVPADELIKSWRALLPGFTRTQHTIGLPMIDVAGADAIASAPVVAWHHIKSDTGEERIWIVGGRYEWRLVNEAGHWRIKALTLSQAWQEGDRDLPTLAVTRATGDLARSEKR